MKETVYNYFHDYELFKHPIRRVEAKFGSAVVSIDSIRRSYSGTHCCNSPTLSFRPRFPC